jgi:hypothetical protein
MWNIHTEDDVGMNIHTPQCSFILLFLINSSRWEEQQRWMMSIRWLKPLKRKFIKSQYRIESRSLLSY